MKKIKSISIIVFILILSLGLVACGDKREEISIYNWGDYIDPAIIKEFEREFNLSVLYKTFSSNEDMYIAIKKGSNSYDVAFPSDYMIERMIDEDLLEKIDKDLITNMKNIDSLLLHQDFDPNNDYSIPYFWGSLGIVYNKNYVDKSEAESWDILWNPKYKQEIFMLDSQRDAFAVALKRLGYSMNSRDLNELEEAKDELIKQKDIVYAYVGDEIKDLMVGEEAQLGLVWSGDALTIINQNDNMDYAVPKEGSNLWFDNMVIPKNARNKKMANEFINFLNRPEIAARNSEYVEYPTANLEARKLLPEEIAENKIAYPSEEIIERAEVFRDSKDMLRIYNDLWIEVKASRK